MSVDNHLAEYLRIVDEYAKVNILDGLTLNNLLRDATVNQARITNELTILENQHNNKIQALIITGASHAKAKNTIDAEMTDYIKLKRIADSVETTINAIRTNISYIKSERANV